MEMYKNWRGGCGLFQVKLLWIRGALVFYLFFPLPFCMSHVERAGHRSETCCFLRDRNGQFFFIPLYIDFQDIKQDRSVFSVCALIAKWARPNLERGSCA